MGELLCCWCVAIVGVVLRVGVRRIVESNKLKMVFVILYKCFIHLCSRHANAVFDDKWGYT